MLAADKLLVQSQLKRQATELKEKEFTLHHGNVSTVGTQAAVLAGLNITMFIEFQCPKTAESVLMFFYYTFTVLAFSSNVYVVSHTTLLSVLGTGLALRGPDGSMITATEVMFKAKVATFHYFALGLISTLLAAIFACNIVLPQWIAVVCSLIILNIVWKLYTSVRDLQSAFHYEEAEAVDLSDLLGNDVVKVGNWMGSAKRAAIRAMPTAGRSRSKRKDDKPSTTEWNEVVGRLVWGDSGQNGHSAADLHEIVEEEQLLEEGWEEDDRRRRLGKPRGL